MAYGAVECLILHIWCTCALYGVSLGHQVTNAVGLMFSSHFLPLACLPLCFQFKMSRDVG
jgi:hypothetical protein